MVALRFESVEEPMLRSPHMLTRTFMLLARAEMMSLLPDEERGAIGLSRRYLSEFARSLMERGVAPEQTALLYWAACAEPFDPDDLEAALQATIDAVDASPRPEGEWRPAREILGEELLSQLVQVSPASLRRYAAGGRRTPDDAAWRLHLVARLLAALAGSYNDYGMRRWFVRPRSALDGSSATDVLQQAESEDDPRIEQVVALAEQLLGSLSAT